MKQLLIIIIFSMVIMFFSMEGFGKPTPTPTPKPTECKTCHKLLQDLNKPVIMIKHRNLSQEKQNDMHPMW